LIYLVSLTAELISNYKTKNSNNIMKKLNYCHIFMQTTLQRQRTTNNKQKPNWSGTKDQNTLNTYFNRY